MRSHALDRSRLDIARNSQTLRVSAVAHLVQLFNRDVVTLAVLYAAIGQVAEQQQNGRRHSAKFKIDIGLNRHRIARPQSAPSGKPPQLNSTRQRGENQDSKLNG